ncbi:thioesterase family protein [Brevundimonas sp.]|uniref:thioesterase family protein n=1 Tax=Brevundimonas sp. TaxID=1871086 RepID=UPI00263311B6|nr:thioesterase family protein [Brevundimonas sp.]
METLSPGLKHTQSLVVTEGLTVPSLSPVFPGFADMPPVLATAMLVGFVEWTCVEALRPVLDAPLKTVGVHIDLSHSAATPVGMAVTAEVELIAVEGRRLTFSAKVRDGVEVIAEGRHARFVVDPDRFLDRLATKSGAANGSGVM